MAKRFTDTELSDKDWFMSLSCRLKCVVRYLFDKCDNAGVWNPNYKLGAVFIGEPFTENEVLEIDGGEQFEKFGGKILVKGFIDFQYGELSEKCKPHIPIINKLKKYGLYEKMKGYPKGIDTLKEKEKDKEKEKEKDLGKSENPLPPENPLPAENPLIPEMQKIFKNEIPEYFADSNKDFEPLLKISGYVAKIYKLPENILAQTESDKKEICRRWGELVGFISKDEFYKNYSLMQIEKHFQSILSKQNNGFKPINKISPKQQATSNFINLARADYEAATGREAGN